MKVLFLDTETTGTDPKVHGVIQIGGIVFIDGMEQERFDIKLRPAPGKQVDAEALAVSGTSMQDLAGRQSARDGWNALVSIMERHIDKYSRTDKFILAGYNVRFDDDMLRELWKSMGDQYYGSWFWTPPVDVMVLAAARFALIRPAMPNFKLETVAKHLGLELMGEAHDALVDIQMTVDIAKLVAPELFSKE